MLDEEVFIKSCCFVQKEVKRQLNTEVTASFINEQMHALGLKYKKIKRIPFQGNSEKTLVLR